MIQLKQVLADRLVQTGTSDSVVFSSGSRLMVGGSMPGYKQAAHMYGLAVFCAS